MIQRETKEMRKVYRDFLLEWSKKDETIAVLEADLSSSMSTDSLKDMLGKRYINVGIMEAQMIGTAAGLSILGYNPYIHTFGPFASRRVYDQVFISLAYAQLNATIIGSDAGVTAEMNGGTHMPFEELGLIRLIPNVHLFEVSDDLQFKYVLEKTRDIKGLKYIRTIRKNPVPLYENNEDFSKGYVQLREGKEGTIIASGIMVEKALEAADLLEKKGVFVSVIDLFRIKPINQDIIDLVKGKPIITAENHNRIGGLGSAICEILSDQLNTPIQRIGVNESFGQVGKKDYLMEIYGLTSSNIAQSFLNLIN